MPDDENASGLVFLERGNPHGASAKHVFDNAEREIAVFDVNDLGRPTQALAHLDKSLSLVTMA